AVVGVDHVQRAVVDGEIVVGNVHSPVERAGRVVIHPHTLAVVVGAAVGTGPGAPGDAVSGRPQADALAAAPGRQVAGEPHAQARVVHHDRVAEVSPVAGTERLASVPGGPVISGVGEAAVAAVRSAAVVVVDDPGVVGAAPFHALRLGHLRIRTVR